jgi:glycosyltransferase involved in cell wall biosynthesis
VSGPILSLVVPTIGRPGLERALASVAAQPEADRVEVVVVADTHGREVAAPDLAAFRHAAFHRLDARVACYGHPQRNLGIRVASAPWLAFLDDDDAWTEGALGAILAGIAGSPDRPLMFRMAYPDGTVLWRRRALAVGNVGTPMFVCPRHPDLLGHWGLRYEGDFDFFSTTLARYPEGRDALVWRPEVVCAIRPEALSPEALS